MAEENSAGASYLASLKQSTAASTSGTAAARAPEAATYPDFSTEPSLTPQPKAVFTEKRRSPRYRCQGSAHLKEIITGVATWATFTDISLHGGYVEAMSTYPVGARLALTLELNGFRIETRAEVRVIYPGLGMGICFLSLPERQHQQFQELLKSLSQPSVLNKNSRTPIELPLTYSRPNVADPRAALQSIVDFFEQRHILSRDEFLRILKKSQRSGN